MAIERQYLQEYIAKELINSTNALNYSKILSTVTLPRYDVDFGVVTYGTISHYTVLIDNYTNNNKVDLKMSQDPKCYKRGVFVKYDSTSLLPKMTKSIDIIFQPTKKDYPYPVCFDTLFCVHVCDDKLRLLFLLPRINIIHFLDCGRSNV